MIYPVPKDSIITQTYQDHVERAKRNGWCYRPGRCPGGVWYYGGIDWAVMTGTPVQAAESGLVVTARQDATGYGTHIKINHEDGRETIYAHLSELRIQAGDRVIAGQVIGLSGNTGNSTGPHLHFELRVNGIPVDPMPYLTGEIQAGDNDNTPEKPAWKEIKPGDIVTIASPYRIRAAPGTTARILATIANSTQAEVISLDNTGWAEVVIRGWVHPDGLIK